jgi:class 3 adenylate cyclase
MPELPTGTVTFLLTDIEGSTTRWEHHPEAMRTALARHDTLLRQVITAHGGVVFKMVGDAVYAAFAVAADAVTAALAAQRAVMAEEWGEVAPLRVRMALHTGAVQQRENDYFGPPLNRVARLISAGYGGQVLLSLATVELARNTLPAGVSAQDLGEHALKDLLRPEHVFQCTRTCVLSTASWGSLRGVLPHAMLLSISWCEDLLITRLPTSHANMRLSACFLSIPLHTRYKPSSALSQVI